MHALIRNAHLLIVNVPYDLIPTFTSEKENEIDYDSDYKPFSLSFPHSNLVLVCLSLLVSGNTGEWGLWENNGYGLVTTCFTARNVWCKSVYYWQLALYATFVTKLYGKFTRNKWYCQQVACDSRNKQLCRLAYGTQWHTFRVPWGSSESVSLLVTTSMILARISISTRNCYSADPN